MNAILQYNLNFVIFTSNVLMYYNFVSLSPIVKTEIHPERDNNQSIKKKKNYYK